MIIILQKQYDQSYQSKSSSIENSYHAAYNSYTTESNSIATSYNNEMNSYYQASTAVSNANQATDDKYNQKMASYNAVIKAISSDQHLYKTETITNGGFVNLTYKTDITWHWNGSGVTVTNVKLNITRSNPEQRVTEAPGFWDTIVWQKPTAPLPSFITHEVYAEPDYVTSANEIWNNLNHNDVFGYFCQNDKSEEYSIQYSGNTPYEGTKNPDGSYTLLNLADRYHHIDGYPESQGSPWGDPKWWHKGSTASALWAYESAVVTPKLPIKPTPGGHQQEPPTPPNPDRPTPPFKESVTKQIASVSYHPNKVILNWCLGFGSFIIEYSDGTFQSYRLL